MRTVNVVLLVAFSAVLAGAVAASFLGYLPEKGDGLTAEARTEAFVNDEKAVWSGGLSALVFVAIFMFMRTRGEF